MRYDALVVGAGSAGCMAAYALAKRGLEVLLVDKRPRASIGNKICGNGLGRRHLERIGLNLPSEVVTNKRVNSFYIYTPAGYLLDAPGGEREGVMLARHSFGQYLLSLAEDAGAEVRAGTQVRAGVVEDDSVRGVETSMGERLEASLVIDASGLKSPVRARLPGSWGFPRDVGGQDVCVCYREIRRVRRRLERPEYCVLYLDQLKYPLGYGWVFPQDEETMNVGLGVGKVDGAPHPRTRLYETLLRQEMFEGSELVSSGMGPPSAGMEVPVRRCWNTLVANGLMFAGDAGCTINPSTAGGNGPALVSGTLAGEVAADALEKGDTTAAGLWRYNELYYSETEYGARYAALDAFRLLLQSCSNHDLDYAVKQEIVRGSDLLGTTTTGGLSMGIVEKATRAVHGGRNISLLRRLRFTARQMREIKEECTDYPPPKEFPDWARRMDARFAAIKERLPPYTSWLKA